MRHQNAGGNDELNTVVPYADPTYITLRPTIGISPDKVKPLNDGVGLTRAGKRHDDVPVADEHDRLRKPQVRVDFRSVYQTVIGYWLQGDAKSVLGASFPELAVF